MKIEKKQFGFTNSGVEVHLFRLVDESGAYIELTNYGATWVSAVIPDRNGNLSDVILGYDSLAGYLADTAYLGSTVGRFANRIGNARFTLNRRTYKLDRNDGNNTNHSGFSGFNKKVFDYQIENNKVVFSLFSPDGEGGFPGNLRLNVTYSFSEDLTVTIHYSAESDQDTYLNLTNHAYFNLYSSGNILEHSLYIPSTEMLVTDEFFIPTGEFTNVDNTPFDFSKPKQIGRDIFQNNLQLINNKGYNHCYVLDNPDAECKHAAVLYEPKTCRQLEVFTTKPALLIYSAGFLNSVEAGKTGHCYSPYAGFCLETQFFPDSPNQPSFPDCVLRKGEVYEHRTEYKFSVRL
ncbi:MAG: galactose mutarotase [Paludibacter sp.]|nr:galactose mutarotase [Paludibacter sp.]